MTRRRHDDGMITGLLTGLDYIPDGRGEYIMKKYIWNPQVAVDNLKKLGQNILLIIIAILMCICPTAWL